MIRTFAFALAALAVTAAPALSAKPQAGPSAAASRGLAVAQQRCAACHAVTENGVSPKPESPPFQDIANRPGVASATLRQFLRDSHSYPEEMNFRLERGQIGDLAAYIATLRRPKYKPVM